MTLHTVGFALFGSFCAWLGFIMFSKEWFICFLELYVK